MNWLKWVLAGFAVSLTLAAVAAYCYVSTFWGDGHHWNTIGFVVFIMFVGFALPAKIIILVDAFQRNGARKALDTSNG